MKKYLFLMAMAVSSFLIASEPKQSLKDAEAALAKLTAQLRRDIDTPKAMAMRHELAQIQRDKAGATGKEMAQLSMRETKLRRDLTKLESLYFEQFDEYKAAVAKVRTAKRNMYAARAKAGASSPHSPHGTMSRPTRTVARRKDVKVGKLPEITDANVREHSQKIDQIVNQLLKDNQVKGGSRVTDQTFLRRVYLDIAGRIPTLEEYETFMASRSSNKRSQLIDELLNSDAYVSRSLNYWLDALRVLSKMKKTEGNGYIVWLRKKIKENMPYDQLVKTLVTSEGRLYDPEHAGTAYYMRDFMMLEESISNTMQLFLATDMVCAQCHDHPFSDWTQMDYYKLAAFINGVRLNNTHSGSQAEPIEKYVRNQLAKGGKKGAVGSMSMSSMVGKVGDKKGREYAGMISAYKRLAQGVYYGGSGTINLPPDYKYRDGKPNQLVNADVPFGPSVRINYKKTYGKKFDFYAKSTDKKPVVDVNSRGYLAEWITSPKNPMFTKTIVNRLWDRVFGAPLIGDLLDLELQAKGENPELTNYLIEMMKSANYDMKLFMKILYNTSLYQREAVNISEITYLHQGPALQRLSAEQIWDSLLAIRKSNPDAGVIDGQYTRNNLVFLAMNERNDKERLKFVLGDGLNTLSKKNQVYAGGVADFPVRASMMRSPHTAGSFLDLYGQSQRVSIDAAVKEATIPQALHLMNNKTYWGISKASQLYQRLGKSGVSQIDQKSVTLAFNAVLTRDPTNADWAKIKPFFQGNKTSLQDLVWVLVNTTEFKMRK